MNLLSVNESLRNASKLSGACVTIEGILAFENEDISISHWPKAERHDVYRSSIWIDPHEVVFDFNEDLMTRWSGKRVVVFGIFEPEEPSHTDGWRGGFGPFGLWPARIRARRIDLLKRWLRDHPEIDNTKQAATPNHPATPGMDPEISLRGSED